MLVSKTGIRKRCELDAGAQLGRFLQAWCPLRYFELAVCQSFLNRSVSYISFAFLRSLIVELLRRISLAPFASYQKTPFKESITDLSVQILQNSIFFKRTSVPIWRATATQAKLFVQKSPPTFLRTRKKIVYRSLVFAFPAGWFDAHNFSGCDFLPWPFLLFL